MKYKNLKRWISITMVCITLILCMPITAFAQEYSVSDIVSIAKGIVNWKKADNGSSANGYLINAKYLEQAGTTPGDWYQIGMSRMEFTDNYEGYLAVIKQKVEKRYTEKGKLSASKATEWHRISLAITACHGNALSVGTDTSGNPINLIADGIYNRGRTVSLGKQGINGWIWGLIALDARKYEVPKDAHYTRDAIIAEILKRQLSDGGFALSGNNADPDITAMAIQALAPYYKRANVKTAIDRAVTTLSNLQLATGDYASWGTQNVESTCQVVIALCCLGIDPLKDNRFIKNGNTLLDGILQYRMADGGFVHSYTYDPDNPTSKPDKSNTMAGEQTLLAMAALWRLKTGRTSLYDFSDIKIISKAQFTEADKAAVNALPENPSTADYVTVVTLLEKLEKGEDFAGKEQYRQKLLTAKKKIENIQEKIEDINETIKGDISPNQDKKDTGKKKEMVDSVISEYENLSEEDKKKVEGYEDIMKEKTRIITKDRAIMIAVIGSFLFLTIGTVTLFSIRKRVTRKKKEMEELEKQFENEE